MHSRVVLPDVGSPRPRLSVWYVRVGDTVLAGERLVEILIDNATIDIPAPDTGRVAEFHARIDDVLTPGQILATIETAFAN